MFRPFPRSIQDTAGWVTLAGVFCVIATFASHSVSPSTQKLAPELFHFANSGYTILVASLVASSGFGAWLLMTLRNAAFDSMKWLERGNATELPLPLEQDRVIEEFLPDDRARANALGFALRLVTGLAALAVVGGIVGIICLGFSNASPSSTALDLSSLGSFVGLCIVAYAVWLGSAEFCANDGRRARALVAHTPDSSGWGCQSTGPLNVYAQLTWPSLTGRLGRRCMLQIAGGELRAWAPRNRQMQLVARVPRTSIISGSAGAGTRGSYIGVTLCIRTNDGVDRELSFVPGSYMAARSVEFLSALDVAVTPA